VSFAEITRPVDGRTEIPAGWAQGRSTFGGLLAAFGYEAAAMGVEPPARTIVARLLEPVAPGGVTADVAVLREGRSVEARSVTLSQQGRRIGVVDVVFGASRDSVIRVAPPPAPEGDPQRATSFGHIPGVTPEFLQHLDVRWAGGSPPFSGGPDAHVSGFCRHRTAAHGVGAILGLLDAWPAPVLGLHDAPFAASTVQWTTHLTGAPLATDAGPTSLARFRSDPVWSADGYATIQGFLWGSDGELVAWSEQLVAVYA